MKIEYWTVYDRANVCTKSPTLAAAKQSAKSCEDLGGIKHIIYKVERIPQK